MRVVADYPHDPKAFTQGLQFDRECDDDNKTCFDIFWESTGLNGRSSIRQVELATGTVRRQRDFPYEHFGEGSTRLGDTLYMITWRTGQGFKISLDLQQVEPIDTGLGDGWGLTNDGTHLIASESSQVIHWLDPDTMQEVRRIQVTDRGHPIRWLNELEVVEGELWGNVWQTECIARVDMQTGLVKGWIHLHGLREGLIRQGLAHDREMDVLNGMAAGVGVGIAYDPSTRRLFLTGKLWPRVFEVEVVPFPEGQAPPLSAVDRLCWPPHTNF
ncbi:hypothetical protein VOLCADRAFT_95857 [Volvox carteri f. nagariensis]|uniref:Glutamine cyclotransferase n=1 Tax=Volvox carteri f. nagariensis TaxID=3068 RepID=D8U8K1_VOLCA|nr:uncharacterized protein VOLCADRAFT_95857 [Volvox carteri f. nagariensis]EFJ43996.1 hypothetical protein VOLCADRAFT_95857 [Volvox carteri f. nagariensis]|eukprot:XP_002955008.1 hypothetical protein VOLCADRAFT_95857 [Volvox carteri f. nagariensis]